MIPEGACVVGATGGSGTRVVARILQGAGVYIGSELSESLNALAPAELFERPLAAYLAGESVAEFDAAFEVYLAKHLEDRPEGARWGLKAHRTIYLIPFLAERLPGMRFMHVIRDGRDIAFSDNQLQLEAFGDILLPPELENASVPERAIALWSLVNCKAADEGERILGDRYAVTRFADMCARPVEETLRILRFFGLGPDPAAEVSKEVETPPSVGRWHRHPELAPRLEELGREGLVRFGYLPA